MARTLSKSDFKIAQTCPTKLYYKKLRYPSANDRDEYLRLLSDGGYMVEKLAKLLYPDGIALDYGSPDRDEEARRTLELLTSDERVVLFEATLLSRGKLARVDILAKNGSSFDLIEVKAKSWNGAEAADRAAEGYPPPFRGKLGGIVTGWQPYLEDVTFQCLVLRELFPDAAIRSFLFMPDKAKTTVIDEMHRLFSIRRELAAGASIERIQVDFLGDPAAVRAANFLTLVPVDDAVEELLPAVRHRAEHYVASLEPELAKIPTPISVACKDCEYHALDGDERSGFFECWGELGRVEPHIFDMFSVGTIGGRKDPIANHLIASGKARLFDIDEGMLRNKKGELGVTGERQLVQLTNTRENREWVGPDLAHALSSLEYPLHFIDFETSRLAIPYHAEMRPYGLVCFEWSCHTIREPGAQPVHTEWLNSERAYPNFEFAESLRACVGSQGSVLTWAKHEESSLAEIAREIAVRRYDGPELGAWLTALLSKESGRMVDMNEITRKYYYHPLMKGRTSIKWVLDAVWKIDPAVRSLFQEYGGDPECPYRTLPPLEIGGRPARVMEGTEAMRAYQDMMYGEGRDDVLTRDKYRKLLLQYCKLDSAAMVMIWDHWRRVAAPRETMSPQPAVTIPTRA